MFAQVVILRRTGGHLPEELIYRVPAELASAVGEGSVLSVPFIRGFTFGVVTGLAPAVPPSLLPRVKPLAPDRPPVFRLPAHFVAWARDLAAYYRTSLPAILRLMLPEAIRNNKFTMVAKRTPERGALPDRPPQTDTGPLSAPGSLVLRLPLCADPADFYQPLIQDTLKQGKQVLFLTPEALLARYRLKKLSLLTAPGRLLDGSLPRAAGAELDQFLRVLRGEVDLVIGTRSTLFTPLTRPGLILIDQEHSDAYWSESSPHYQAQEAACLLGAITGVRVVLASPAPRVTSFFTATQKQEIAVPFSAPVHVVDMRGELQQGNRTIFSGLLKRGLAAAFAARKPVILFINRRGQGGGLLCRDCGQIILCPRCSVALRPHQSGAPGGTLKCHTCPYAAPVPSVCPHCLSVRLKTIGLGTQKAQAEAQRLLPHARIARAESDTVADAGAFKKLYDDFQAGNYDVLIGTQMILKGLPFPNLGLAAMLLPDTGLHLPDFRSGERVFQQIAELRALVAPAQVLIQTYNPDAPPIDLAARNRYQAFFQQELAFRKLLRCAPYAR